MAEEVIELILRQYNLYFFTYEIPRGVYTSGDNIDYNDEISKRDIKIVIDDITMKNMLPEGSNIIKFDDQSFLRTILGCEPY